MDRYGIDKPRDYSKEEIEGIFSKGELGEDNIYTPGKDDDTDVKSKPNIIYLQLESFIDPTRVQRCEILERSGTEFPETYEGIFLWIPDSSGGGCRNGQRGI